MLGRQSQEKERERNIITRKGKESASFLKKRSKKLLLTAGLGNRPSRETRPRWRQRPQE
jgi:hypothetical protein